jgi:hypothetical protein
MSLIIQTKEIIFNNTPTTTTAKDKNKAPISI